MKISTAQFEAQKGVLLDRVIAQEITKAQFTAALGTLESQRDEKELTPKVSQKGGCSVYGLQRMPVTLYPNQWERLFAAKDLIMGYINEHRSEFSVKGAPPTEEDVDAALEAVA
jgi:hypothetical protein